MTKQEAVKRLVGTEFSSIPTEWVKIIRDSLGEYMPLPMWGWMWQIDEFHVRRLMPHTVIMDESLGDDFVQDMEGARWIKGTNIYLYELDGKPLIGVHGAGFSFYDEVWPDLYDLMELKWHDEEKTV